MKSAVNAGSAAAPVAGRMFAMSEPARRVATWNDLAATPDDGRVYEVLDGEVEASPRPLPVHSRAQAIMASEIAGPFDRGRGGHGGWWILIKLDVELGDHQIVVPDLAGWLRSRLINLAQERPITTVPDWICEVVSPSERGRDRLRKADLYLRVGVPHY